MFCPDPNTIRFCPPGTYNPNTGATNINQCQACPLGNYCPGEGRSSFIPCDRGNYCAAGSSNQEPCPAGNFCTTPSSKQQCTLYNYCAEGVTTPTRCCLQCASISTIKLGQVCPAGSTQNPTSCPCNP
jgi:hypothetical protein